MTPASVAATALPTPDIVLAVLPLLGSKPVPAARRPGAVLTLLASVEPPRTYEPLTLESRRATWTAALVQGA